MSFSNATVLTWSIPIILFRYVRLIAVESLRLYPQPPLLIRRSLKSDTLPGTFSYEGSNSIAQNSFSSSFFVSFCSMHDVSWLIFRNHILNDAGGYNGVKDGYPIPPGTDLFISVSLFHCLFLFDATIILIPISLIEHRVDYSTLLPLAGV